MRNGWKRLRELLVGFEYTTTCGRSVYRNILVKDVISDSRRAAPDTVFVCTVGGMHDSHSYAQAVYDAGCRVFVAEHALPLPEDTVQIFTENGRQAMAKMVHAFYGNPAEHLHIIGVTGTKGKTTIANLTADVLNRLGIKTGCIGTNGVSYGGETRYTGYTTPDSYELAKTFAELLHKGAECVVMEVSSLGIKQHRTDGILFDIGVFTNLSPDHIGEREHPTMEDYIASKAAMFAQSRYAIINADDAVSERMITAARDAGNTVCTFALNWDADYTAHDIAPWQEQSRFGVGFDSNVLGGRVPNRFVISQPGKFSVYNALAVLAVCRQVLAMRGEEVDAARIRAALKSATVAGRMELVDVLPDATVVIDYAHNELSMTSLLTTLRQYTFKRLVLLFGSVGCRSQLRRIQLGRTAAQYADFCILTSDNPDTEDPMRIIRDIAAAFSGSNTPYVEIPDREEAVRYAITHYQPGDMIVLAGKGHEDFQLINGVKVPFSEKEIIRETVSLMQHA